MTEPAEDELAAIENDTGISVPLPDYLPDGYLIQRILNPDDRDCYIDSESGTVEFPVITLIIGDREIEGYINYDMLLVENDRSGLLEVAGENALQIDIVCWQSYPFSWESYLGAPDLELPPEKKISDGITGYSDKMYLDSSGENFLRLMSWTMPDDGTPEFVFTVFAGEKTPEDELIKIAVSIKIK
ncbi:MAG: hypothetical protein JW762_01680 [Dehalococcoidales bacterium]|nr:hypothetical protein [Dehalococcoidales bacterium]